MTKARSNAVANAAKGDLTVGSGTNLSGVLGVGSNGDTIVADSSTATGLSYQANTSAGKNRLLNGDFNIWQRGTSFTNPDGLAYSSDRWTVQAPAGIVSRQSSGLTGFTYALRISRASGSTSTRALLVGQSLESATSIPLAGKYVTLSFYARAGANYSATSGNLAVVLANGTGTDQNIVGGYTGSNTILSPTAVLTTSWQRFTYTGLVPTNATELGFYLSGSVTGTAGANDYYEVTGVQLEQSTVVTAFQTATGTIQGELAACQRYYYRNVAANIYGNLAGSGSGTSSTNVRIQTLAPVNLRVSPTSVDFANLGTDDGAAGAAISNVTINSGGTWGAALSCTSTGVTQYRPYTLQAFAAGAYVGLSAEL